MEKWTVEDELDVELEGVRRLSVRLVGGDVVVTGGEGPARLQVTEVESGAVHVSLVDGELKLTHQQDEHGGFWGFLRKGGTPRARVLVTVPASTAVDIGVVSADLVVAGLTEPAKVNTVSGDVTLTDLAERVAINTVSGDVEASRLAGDIKYRAVSGDLTVVNGTSRWLTAQTVSGDIVLDLEPAEGAVYSITTVSGDVALRVPGEPSLIVEANSVSGDITTDWGLRWEDQRAGRRKLRDTLGSGDARLVVKTVSGDLRIHGKREAA